MDQEVFTRIYQRLEFIFEFCNFFHVRWSRRKSVKRRADYGGLLLLGSHWKRMENRKIWVKGPRMNFSSPQITRDLFTWLNSVSFCSFISLNLFHPHRSSSILSSSPLSLPPNNRISFFYYFILINCSHWKTTNFFLLGFSFNRHHRQHPHCRHCCWNKLEIKLMNVHKKFSLKGKVYY